MMTESLLEFAEKLGLVVITQRRPLSRADAIARIKKQPFYRYPREFPSGSFSPVSWQEYQTTNNESPSQ